MSQQQPAGWYNQPDGTQRYWDGSQWTNQVAPGAGAPPPPPMAQQGLGKPKKPWFKKWWVWAIAILLLIGFGQLGGGGTSTTTSTGGATTASTEGATTATQTTASKKARLTLDDGWAVDRSNQFAVYVKGYVSNNSDKAITNYVQITFDALDSTGANLGTCLANTNTIDANGKWKFEAICTSDASEIETVRFKEITGF